MTLEKLIQRKSELEMAINQTTNQVYVFQGHKQEVDYQISELEKVAAEVESFEVIPVE